MQLAPSALGLSADWPNGLANASNRKGGRDESLEFPDLDPT